MPGLATHPICLPLLNLDVTDKTTALLLGLGRKQNLGEHSYHWSHKFDLISLILTHPPHRRQLQVAITTSPHSLKLRSPFLPFIFSAIYVDQCFLLPLLYLFFTKGEAAYSTAK